MKASPELTDLMNQAIELEIEASMQYLWQHILWNGIDAFAVKEQLKALSDEERGHAEDIADRLYFLGGIPTKGLQASMKSVPIGDNLMDQLAVDNDSETATITLYNKIVEQAIADKDKTTEWLFREILSDEEGHLNIITGLQAKR